MRQRVRAVLTFLLVASFFAVIPNTAAADYILLPNIDSRSGVTFDVNVLYDHFPRRGFMPIRIRIHNKSGKAREWIFRSESSVGYRGASLSYRRELRVPDGRERTFLLFVPIADISPSHGAQVNRFFLDGYGLLTSELPGVTRYYPHTPTAFVMIGEALGLGQWAKLDNHFKSIREDLVGTVIPVDNLPDDWRGFAGVDSLWLTSGEWNSLTEPQRTTIVDFVFSGGNFHLAANEFPLSLQPFASSVASDDLLSYGVGSVRIFRAGELDPARFEVELRSDEYPSDSLSPHRLWRGPGAPESDIPVALLLALTCCYAFLIGPVNLLYLAPYSARHRLFWTTPLLALLAAALLALIIFFKDGLGGAGSRVALVLRRGDSNQVSILQHQISKTGFLAGTSFQSADTVSIALVGDQVSDFLGARLFQTGSSYQGDWFANRNVQRHQLRTVKSSRSRIRLLERSSSSPPQMQSNFPAVVRNLYYVDTMGEVWKAENVGPGETFRPVASRPSELSVWVNQVGSNMGSRAEAALQAFVGTPSVILAQVDGSSDLIIDTLGSIRWTSTQAIVVQDLRHASGAGHE